MRNKKCRKTFVPPGIFSFVPLANHILKIFLLDMEWIVTIFGVSYLYTNPWSICFILLEEKYSRTDKHWDVTVIGAIDILIIFLVVNNET